MLMLMLILILTVYPIWYIVYVENNLRGINMDIALKIKELRKKAELTQVDFARRAGVGLRFIRDLEQGKKTIRMDKLNQLLEYFGYHLEAVKNERK